MAAKRENTLRTRLSRFAKTMGVELRTHNCQIWRKFVLGRVFERPYEILALFLSPGNGRNLERGRNIRGKSMYFGQSLNVWTALTILGTLPIYGQFHVPGKDKDKSEELRQ